MTTPIDLRISCLPHTWLIDLDGTVLTHNGYLSDNDRLLPGVTEFWQKIPECDIIILLSAREIIYAENTLNLLKKWVCDMITQFSVYPLVNAFS